VTRKMYATTMFNAFDTDFEHELLDSGDTTEEETVQAWAKTWGGGEENYEVLPSSEIPTYSFADASPLVVNNFTRMCTAEKISVYKAKNSEDDLSMAVWNEMSKENPTAFISNATLPPTQMPTPTSFVANPTLPHAKCKATIQKTPTPPKKLGTPTKTPTPARLLANRQAADRSRKNVKQRLAMLETQAELHAVEKAEMLALHATVMQQAENATKLLQETNAKLLYSETLLASTLAKLAMCQRSV
jgi:hypothetical protein